MARKDTKQTGRLLTPLRFPLFVSSLFLSSMITSTAHASLFSSLVSPSQKTEKAKPSLCNPNIFVEVSQKVIPSVVNISTETDTHPTSKMSGSRIPPFWGRSLPTHPFGNSLPRQALPSRKALGTGVIIEVEKDHLVILTNHHVVKGATTIKVQFTEKDKEASIATLVGEDKALDLALLRVKKKSNRTYKALPFGSSEKLQIGEYVVAVGNPYGQGHSVTHGIVSAKGRTAPTVGEYIQTDTAINPGNSGGPLVNLKGEIIGINNAILAHAEGIGFSIPSDEIKKVLPQLKNNGKVDRGFIGIQMGAIPPYAVDLTGGAVKEGQPYVAEVMTGSPAEKAGTQKNDIILTFAGKSIDSPESLKKAVMSEVAETQVEMTVLRKGKKVTLKVKLGKA